MMKYLIRWDEDENGKKVFLYSGDKKHKNTDKRYGWKIRCNDCDISSRNGGKTLKQSNDTFLAVRSYHSSICDGELKTSKSYHATEIGHSYTEVASEITHTSTYIDVTGALISNTEFSAGNKYLLLISALVGGSSASGLYSHKVIHGSTDFADSENEVEPTGLRTTHMQSYNYFTVWTAIGGEDIILQHQASTGTVGTQATTMIAIDLDDNLVEDEDWQYDSDNTSTGLTDVFSVTNNASITIDAGDHSAGVEYLVLALGRTTIGDESTRVYTRMERTGEVTTNTNNLQKEGEDTNENCLHFIAETYTLGNADNTFTQTSATSSGTAHSRTHSAVFSLNLTKFKTFKKVFTASDVYTQTADFTQQLQTMVLIPFFTGDFFLMSRFAHQNGTSLRTFQYRQQINQVDAPTGQSTVSNGFNPWDVDDFTQWCMPTVQNFTVGTSYTIDIDSSVSSLTGVGIPVDIMILLFSFEFEKSFDVVAGGMFDVAIFGDNVQFDTSVDWVVNLVDGIGISDVMTGDKIQNRFISEVITVGADVLNAMQVLFRSITEPAVTIGAGVVSVVQGLIRNLAEITPISDLVERAGSTYNRVIVEPVTTIIDSITRIVTNIRALSETETIGDAVARVKDFPRIISEPDVVISDMVEAVKVWVRSLSETTIVVDFVDRVVSGIREITEPAVIIGADVVSIAKAISTIIVDAPVAISDLITRAVVAFRTMTESEAISDSVSRLGAISRIITEPSTIIGDVVNRLVTMFRTITEPIVNITDNVVVNAFLQLVLTFPTRIKDVLNFGTIIKEDLNFSTRIKEEEDNT